MTELWEELRRTYAHSDGSLNDSWRAVADRARALLTKPVATREAVEAWLGVGNKPNGAFHRYNTTRDVVLAALQRFAAPDRPKMQIEDTQYEDWLAACNEEYKRATGGTGTPFSMLDACWRVAHRLANTRAQTVDEDAGPREMCDTWANTQNAKPGPLRDSVPTFDDGNDEWKARWRQHYAWVLSGFPKEPEWARSREGGGR